MNNITISASQVSSLFGTYSCQAKYYFDKIARFPKKPSPALDIGKAIENAVTHYNVTGVMDANIFHETIKQLKEGTYKDRFGPQKYGYMQLSEEEKKIYDEEIEDIHADALLKEYTNYVQPKKPIKSQIEVRQEIAPGITLVCYLDYLFADDGIVELKTASRKWSMADMKKKFQHVIEAWGAEMELGFRPPVRYHVLVKTKTPQIQILPEEGPYHVTDEDIEQVKNLLLMAVQQKNNFSYVPTERDKTNCLICGGDHSKDFFFNI